MAKQLTVAKAIEVQESGSVYFLRLTPLFLIGITVSLVALISIVLDVVAP